MKLNESSPRRWFIMALLFMAAAINLRATEEDDLIATLQSSSAAAPEKWTACQRLRVVGSAKAVPAVANLLTNERLSQAARHVLEGLPIPEAGEALRQALGKTSGLLKVGVIDSLGWRGESSAVLLLKSSLTDVDGAIVEAAAAALGRIGGPSAIAALQTAHDSAPTTVQPVIAESLLKCGERFLTNNDIAAAAAVYQDLFGRNASPQVHTAAWRGLVLSEPGKRTDHLLKALAGADPSLRGAAHKLIRQLSDRAVIQACASRWATLPVSSQLAVLEAQAKLGAEALPTARSAGQSPDPLLRAAAWKALGDLNDVTSVPALARAAARGESSERETARESLTRLRGPGARDAVLAQLAQAESLEKAELLRALGERGDRASLKVLLQNAGSDSQPVRLAALESVRQLAPPDAITPLLEIAAKSKSDEQRDPVLKALYAVCEASPDKDQAARNVVQAMGRFPTAERRQILPLLSELATPDALNAAQAASRDSDSAYAKEAVSVLAQWPNAAPAAYLLELSRSSTEPTLQTLALRGAIEVVGQEPNAGKRFTLLQQALAGARRLEEKKQALGQIGQVATPEALQLARQNFKDPGLANEAYLAAVAIAEKLAPANPKLADEVASQVLAEVKEGDLARRAWSLRLKPSSGASFIRDWVVSGPYRQAGLVGALGVFNIPFGPEKSGQAVEWKAAAPADHVNLLDLFPGQENCVAYLRTQVIAPDEVGGVLLLGSDDGIKAWLNGEVVHSNNVDRGEVADQDRAPIRLKKGRNELLLKVSQGGGGWSACARILGTDAKPISGLLVERPTGAAQTVATSASLPPPEPTPATLPKREAFRKLRLSDQFYAEGAYYGDFNRDGKLDVVAGPFWFEGPDFKARHEYRPSKAYDPKDYSDNFLTYTADFNLDGWTDILCVPFPGIEGYWYENPAGKDGPWKKRLAYSKVGNESPTLGDLNGDGRPEFIFCNEGYLGYAAPDPSKPDEPWAFHAVSMKDNRYQRFTHGLGVGDVNKDGRVDLIEAAGWWEQPADLQPGQQWIFHPFHFADAGSQMLVYDVNGDGLADIITAWHCHLYGIVWWQQVRGVTGEPDWQKHTILSPTPDVSTSDFRVSQMHAMELVDMNGDGLKDVLTGKRFWAHGPNGDKEPNAPALLFWFELHRNGPDSATFVPRLIDDDSGVGTQVTATDLNGDGRPDAIVGNKKGIFVHLSEAVKAR